MNLRSPIARRKLSFKLKGRSTALPTGFCAFLGSPQVAWQSNVSNIWRVYVCSHANLICYHARLLAKKPADGCLKFSRRRRSLEFDWRLLRRCLFDLPIPSPLILEAVLFVENISCWGNNTTRIQVSGAWSTFQFRHYWSWDSYSPLKTSLAVTTAKNPSLSGPLLLPHCQVCNSCRRLGLIVCSRCGVDVGAHVALGQTVLLSCATG